MRLLLRRPLGEVQRMVARQPRVLLLGLRLLRNRLKVWGEGQAGVVQQPQGVLVGVWEGN